MNAITRTIEHNDAFNRGGELRPHRFSVQDMYAMFTVGVLEEGAREELIEGELIETPSDGDRHKKLSSDLGFWLCRTLSPRISASCRVRRSFFRTLMRRVLMVRFFDVPTRWRS